MRILRWILRILGSLIALASVATVVAWPIDVSLADVMRTVVQAAFFLMIAGFVAGWKWEFAAGVMILSGYAVFAAINGIVYLNWMLALFPLIGAGYLFLGWPWRKGGTHIGRIRKSPYR